MDDSIPKNTNDESARSNFTLANTEFVHYGNRTQKHQVDPVSRDRLSHWAIMVTQSNHLFTLSITML